jgi:hypothetical protein
MVHNLVTDYISQSDCLILVVISMHGNLIATWKWLTL